jgi:hypothetical protein
VSRDRWVGLLSTGAGLAGKRRRLKEPAPTREQADRRIVEWLASWDPCAVLAGIITRAAAAGQDLLLLTPSDRRTVLDALDVAADCKRDRAASCPECDARPADLCGTCESRLARAGEYDALAARIGGADR